MAVLQKPDSTRRRWLFGPAAFAHGRSYRTRRPESVRVAETLVRDAGFDPVVVGQLADAARFQRGAPGYGQSVTAEEPRKTLSLRP